MKVKGFCPSVTTVEAKLLRILSFKVDAGAEFECRCGRDTEHASFCALPHIRATFDAICDANCPAAQVTGTHKDKPARILKVPLSQREHVVPSLSHFE